MSVNEEVEKAGTYESVKHFGHEALDQPLLDVKRLEHPWKAGREDSMQAVVVVQSDEEGVGPLRVK